MSVSSFNPFADMFGTQAQPVASPQTNLTYAPSQTASAASPFAQTAQSNLFGAPAPRRARAPRLIDLLQSGPGQPMTNRLLLIAPIRIEYGVPGVEPGKTQNRITMDIAVLDGGLIRFGGKPEKMNGGAHDQSVEVPVLFEDVYDSHAGIESAVRDALRNRMMGQAPWMVLGRLFIGVAKGNQNPPFLIGRPDLPQEEQPGPVTPQDAEIAARFLASPLARPMLEKVAGNAR